MTVLDVKQAIKSNNLSSYYIFSGDEIEIQRVYINKIAEIRKCPIIRADSISDIWQDIINPSLFDGNAIYVLRDDKELIQNESIQVQINDGVLAGNILIHLLTSVDKRTKYYKQNKDNIVIFEHLSNEVLKKYIRKQITLNNANCERLIAICENDYSRILLEINKIKWYVAYYCDYDLTDDVAFEQLVDEGVIYQPPADAIFDLVDAILKRQVSRVYDLLYQSYAVGEANMVILSVLYNNAKQLLQVQACESADICKSTGLTSFQVKCAKEKLNRYSIGELVYMLKLIQQVQKGIITGEIEDNISVEYLLVQVL